jgi:nucleoside-diphosphate-sugar epimerase
MRNGSASRALIAGAPGFVGQALAMHLVSFFGFAAQFKQVYLLPNYPLP